jgi:hypothetical protein
MIYSNKTNRISTHLRKKQNKHKLEHYWAYDGRRVFKKRGEADHVVASPRLEARYDNPKSRVCYHHSHPDERGLSPSDLDLIKRPGVQEIWAHTPENGAYGACLPDGMDKTRYEQAVAQAEGARDPDQFQPWCANHLNPALNAISLSEQDFEDLCDLAATEALEQKGWIQAYIQLSDSTRRKIMGRPEYAVLVAFFRDHIQPA